MPGILTPELALRHLLQLSTDVRAALALDADGRLLAGNPALLAHARELLGVLDAAVGEGRAGELIAPLTRAGELQGTALIMRAGPPPTSAGTPPAPAGAPSTPADAPPADPVALVIAVGPHALLPLLRHDLVALLNALGAATGEPSDTAASAVAGVTIWDASRRVQLLEPSKSAARTAIFAGLGLLDAGKH